MNPHFDQDQDELLGKAYDGRLIRRFIPYVKPYRNRLIVAMTFLLGTSLLDLVPPFLTKIAIDR
jgi:ATP-binding cassette, subfamily B, multidrug efflux pump